MSSKPFSVAEVGSSFFIFKDVPDHRFGNYFNFFLCDRFSFLFQ